LSSLAPPIVSEAMPTAALPNERAIGALWRRIVAFLLDDIIVGVAGALLALPFFEILSRFGAWGRLVGFCVALPYFAILNSKIGNGQTVGKRWMRIQVVDGAGNTLPFLRSAARYAVLAIPYFLNGLVIPQASTPWAVTTAMSVIIFGVGGATVYLMLFNRRTRQGIHDLAVGSYVAVAGNNGPVSATSIWKPHWIILGTLLTALLAGGGIFANRLSQSGPFPELLEDIRMIESIDGVQSAGAQDLRSSTWGSGEVKKILVLNVFWTGKDADETAAADQIAKLIVRQDHQVENHDLLRIVLVRGYDLGIAHVSVTHSYQHTPAEWNARLFGPSQAIAAPTKL